MSKKYIVLVECFSTYTIEAEDAEEAIELAELLPTSELRKCFEGCEVHITGEVEEE